MISLTHRALAPLLLLITFIAFVAPSAGAQSSAAPSGWGDTVASTALPVPSPSGGPFSDVPAGGLDAMAIQYLKDHGIIHGYPDGTYGGQKNINRAEFLKIIVGSTDPKALESYSQESCFWDVPKGMWYTPYVCYAKAHGIVSGYPDGGFHPDWNINFAESAKIVANTFLPIPSGGGFTDPWFKRFVDALSSAKAIPLTVASFDQRISRNDMAAMMYRVKAGVTSHASRTYAELNGEGLVHVATCQELLERTQLSQIPFLTKEGVVYPPSSDMQSSSPGEGTGGGRGPLFTPTNVQVAGVDEGDIVKTDGSYIYIAKADTVRIVQAVPPAELKEVATVQLPLDQSKGEYFYVTELYADGNQLVIIGNYNTATVYPLGPLEMDASRILPPWRNNNVNRVLVFDTTTKASPKLLRSVSIQGNPFTSRRIGNMLYLVTNAYNGVFWPLVRGGTMEGGGQIYDANATVSDVVPTITDSADGSTKPVVDCKDVILFPKIHSSNYLTISAVPLSDLSKPVASTMMVADGNTTYVSANNLYLSSTDWSRVNAQIPSSEQTTVYKFALQNGPTFAGSGEVSGTALNQWSMDEYAGNLRIATTRHAQGSLRPYTASNVYVLNPDMHVIGRTPDLAPGEQTYAVLFSGKRGIVATYRQTDPLFTIDLSSPTNPVIKGALKVPGQPQFIQAWDDNHIISFGLDTAETPTVWAGSEPSTTLDCLPSSTSVCDGQLQTIYRNPLPGSSQGDNICYICQPVPVPPLPSGGIRLGLFDVSNLSDVREVSHLVIGQSGTSSEALYNHKAILVDKANNLLSFPVMESGAASGTTTDQCTSYTYDTCPTDKCQKTCVPSSCTTENGVQICTPDCKGPGSCKSWNIYIEPVGYQNQTVFQGAYVYEVNTQNGFTLKSKITHFSDADKDSVTGQIQWWGSKAVQRILRIGETLYSVSLGMVKAHSLPAFAEIKSAVIVGE